MSKHTRTLAYDYALSLHSATQKKEAAGSVHIEPGGYTLERGQARQMMPILPSGKKRSRIISGPNTWTWSL